MFRDCISFHKKSKFIIQCKLTTGRMLLYSFTDVSRCICKITPLQHEQFIRQLPIEFWVVSVSIHIQKFNSSYLPSKPLSKIRNILTKSSKGSQCTGLCQLFCRSFVSHQQQEQHVNTNSHDFIVMRVYGIVKSTTIAVLWRREKTLNTYHPLKTQSFSGHECLEI